METSISGGEWVYLCKKPASLWEVELMETTKI
ncbi:hypothetical protein CRC_03252 [Cylindrospermopsis raciborskii CS-505]|nr:hypothetical protein CRC_03252 [Cylindrospermopsis raciborskii CS-505]